MSDIPTVHGPEPITLEGWQGSRYWFHLPFAFTGIPEVDDRLSGYPVVVFQPTGRSPAQTPMVIGLQGMAAPYQWNAFLIPTLLDMGIACVLFDTPLAGERSLARNFRGDVLSEIVPLIGHQFGTPLSLFLRELQAVARDCGAILHFLRERHGLNDPRLALFGVSLGTLMASYAFTRDSIGTRLLGTIGHADLRLFARSYRPALTPLLVILPTRALARLAGLFHGFPFEAGLILLTLLHELNGQSAAARAANPMTYCHRVGPHRRVRFLVGQNDPLVRPKDAVACARRFPDGECYVVPGLGHGGDSFVEHVRYFVQTQLSDWSW